VNQPPDRDPRPAPGTRPPEYVAEIWVSHQLKDRIRHLDAAPDDAARAGRHIRSLEPDLEPDLGRTVTTGHDHTHQPAQGHQPASASHRAGAAARRAAGHARAARSVDCQCQARAGAPCGPSGDHLARYLRATQSGALTRDSLKEVIAGLDVIAPRVLIQPPGEPASPVETGTTAGPGVPLWRSADQAGAPARRMPGCRPGAQPPDGEALCRGDGPSPAHAREERDLEAGS
jgi:hypothetical protein